jgi:hypothetical protein
MPRIRILDASPGDHQEEEDFYNKEGEENLDPHFIPRQANTDAS